MAALAIEVRDLAKSYQIQRRRAATSLIDELAARARAVARLLQGEPTDPALETFWALQDVDFEVPVGTAVGLIGSNGSGKTTLLKVLSRITPPTRGRYRLRGRVSSLLEVGTGFHPELSGRQNIFLNGAILGMRRRQIARQLDEIVDFAGVAQFLDEPVKHLSSGMYTRLAFAVAAFLESEILVVDEVLAVGDAAFQDKCLRTMREAAGSGRTVLFVSHNMAAVAQLTRQTLVLQKGRLAFNGATADAIAFYLKDKRDGAFATRQPTRGLQCQAHYRVDPGLFIEEMGPAQGQAPAITPGGAFRMEFLVNSDRPHRGLRINYTINSVTGQPLLSGHSPTFPVRAGRQLIEIELGDLRLVPGDYQFSIYLGMGGWHEARAEFDMYVGVGRLVVNRFDDAGRPFGDWDQAWAQAYHTSSALRRNEPLA